MGMTSSGTVGTAATQLTQAGTDSNKQVVIEVTAEQVAAAWDTATSRRDDCRHGHKRLWVNCARTVGTLLAGQRV